MQYEQRIRRERAGMSKSFAKLADFLLDSYVEVSFMTASELAHALNLDAATVVRFSQHLGYRGFPQLQREIRQKVKGNLLIRPHTANSLESIADVTSSAMRELNKDLEQTSVILDVLALEQLIYQIGQARRIIIVADAPAQPAAYNLLYFLEQGGFSVYIARTGAMDLARTIYTATPQDLIIAIDIAGHSPYIANSLTEAHLKNISTAAIVGAASLPSSRSADIVIAAQSHLSIASGMVVLNALIFLIAESLRWKYAERYAGTEKAIVDLSSRIQQAIE